MTTRSAARIASRVLAVLILFNAAGLIAVNALHQWNGRSAGGDASWLESIARMLPLHESTLLVGGIALWLGSHRLSRHIAGGATGSERHSPRNGEIQAIAFAVLGSWLAVPAAERLVTIGVGGILDRLSRLMLHAEPHFSWLMKAGTIGEASILFVLGLSLFLGVRGIAGLFASLRSLRIGKVSAESVEERRADLLASGLAVLGVWFLATAILWLLQGFLPSLEIYSVTAPFSGGGMPHEQRWAWLLMSLVRGGLGAGLFLRAHALSRYWHALRSPSASRNANAAAAASPK